MDSNQNNEKNPLLIVLTSFSPTMKQILSIQHLDFPLIPSRPFSLPSELCIPHQPNCTQTRDSTYLVYRIKWMLNSDGWMMLHDLKGWMKVQYQGMVEMLVTPCQVPISWCYWKHETARLDRMVENPITAHHNVHYWATLAPFFDNLELPLLFVSFLCPFSHDALFNPILVLWLTQHWIVGGC